MDKYCDKIPKRMLNNLLFCERIVIEKDNFIILVILRNFHLYEVKEDKSIIASFNLQNIFKKSPNLSNTASVVLYRSNNSVQKRLFYLVSISETLAVLERQSIPNLKISYHSRFDYVQKYTINDDQSSGTALVNIYLEGNIDPIITDFESKIIEARSSVNNFTNFNEILKTLKERSNKAKSELATHKMTTQKLFSKMNRDMKNVSIFLRTKNPDEKIPLVKYGDIWLKVHNEKLVIGVPVLNTTYKRRLTLENLQIILVSDEDDKIEYTYKLFKLKDDDFEFKSYQELLDSEDVVNDFPDYQQEWTLCPNYVLQSEQAAVFIITMDLMDFIDSTLFNYECFIQYDIMINGICESLQLHAGNITINRLKLYSEEYWLQFNDDDVFKDLLTLTSTSEFAALELKYSHVPTISFSQFVVDVLQFLVIDTGNTCQIYYHPKNSYWQNMMIRLDTTNLTNLMKIKIKVYCRYEHQILAFVESIHSEYSEECKVTPATRSDSKFDLKQCMLDEIKAVEVFQKANPNSHKISDPAVKAFKEKVFALQLKTDLAFSEK